MKDEEKQKINIAVIGNPNTGKTTLFNTLTGSKQQVGNWPGVTVERKTGFIQHQDNLIELVDLPGIYSLEYTPQQSGLDEQIAQQYLLSAEADVILNIIDATQLERNLYLTSQLLEMARPMVIALNMIDLVEKEGLKIDIERLSQELGVPVIGISAAQQTGMMALKEELYLQSQSLIISSHCPQYAEPIEESLSALKPSFGQSTSWRWLALQLLQNNQSSNNTLATAEQATKLRLDLEEGYEEDLDIVIADQRYLFIQSLLEKTFKRPDVIRKSFSDQIDYLLLNRFLGIPIFLGLMYLMFLFTIHLGGAFIDFFDLLIGAIVVQGAEQGLSALGSPPWLTTFLAEGIGGGIQVVATFIPIIAFLYLFLAMLEDSGYMARAAFVMDRLMRFIGLPGKSFVPLIVGFGCNVPAIMATRTLEHQRDRLLTILMSPFISCGARLPVFALFAAAFFPQQGQNLVFLLYIIGILMAVFTGLIMKNTLLKGEITPFIMELPRYRLPTLKGVLWRTWERLSGFIFRAGLVIVPMVMVITFLSSWGTNGTFGHHNTDESVLSEIGRSVTPIFAPMGIDEENWPATVGIFTGILAKEVVVGTLDAAYSQLADAEKDADSEEENISIWAGIQAAFQSVSANLRGLTAALLDPLGINIGEVSNLEQAAEAQEVQAGTFGSMVERFDGQIGAFAYLLFILMYFPCAAAIAAVYRETNVGWAIFVAFWTTFLAYVSAVLVYQIGTFAEHPLSSFSWIIGLVFIFVGLIFMLAWYGKERRYRLRPFVGQSLVVKPAGCQKCRKHCDV